MKMKFFFCFALVLVYQFVCAESPIIDSKIKKVTAYRDGAFITRIGEVSIPAGAGSFKIISFADQIDPETARINPKGDFEILSIRHQYDFIAVGKDDEEVTALTNKRDMLVKQEKEKLLEKQVFEEELKLLNSDKLISKEKKNLSIQEMNSLMDFYRERLKNIKLSILQVDEELFVLRKELASIRKQINQITQERKKNSQFIVETYSTKPVNSIIELSYWTRKANWISIYDVKVDKITNPLIIHSNASLTNSTGEDWKEIDLVLSTGNPWKSMTIPTVSPWLIDFRLSYPSISMKKEKGYELLNMRSELLMPELNKNNDGTEEYAKLPRTIVSENFTTLEFKIPGKRNILSNNLPHTIKLETHEIEAKFKYVAVPAKSTYGFLKATVNDWQEFNFSFGEATLFFEGTYIGKTYLNPKQATDSLDISFGPDIAVVVTREKSKDYSEKKWFGTKKAETTGYKFEIRNNKSTPIDIQIFDQLPISTNESIKVESLHIGEAKINEETGILTWSATIPSGKGFSDEFAYIVTMPKGEVLASR